MAKHRDHVAMEMIQAIWDAESNSDVIDAIVDCVNKALELAATRIEDELDLYDYDEYTRSAAVEKVRSLKIEKM